MYWRLNQWNRKTETWTTQKVAWGTKASSGTSFPSSPEGVMQHLHLSPGSARPLRPPRSGLCVCRPSAWDASIASFSVRSHLYAVLSVRTPLAPVRDLQLLHTLTVLCTVYVRVDVCLPPHWNVSPMRTKVFVLFCLFNTISPRAWNSRHSTNACFLGKMAKPIQKSLAWVT